MQIDKDTKWITKRTLTKCPESVDHYTGGSIVADLSSAREGQLPVHIGSLRKFYKGRSWVVL